MENNSKKIQEEIINLVGMTAIALTWNNWALSFIFPTQEPL